MADSFLGPKASFSESPLDKHGVLCYTESATFQMITRFLRERRNADQDRFTPDIRPGCAALRARLPRSSPVQGKSRPLQDSDQDGDQDELQNNSGNGVGNSPRQEQGPGEGAA